MAKRSSSDAPLKAHGAIILKKILEQWMYDFTLKWNVLTPSQSSTNYNFKGVSKTIQITKWCLRFVKLTWESTKTRAVIGFGGLWNVLSTVRSGRKLTTQTSFSLRLFASSPIFSRTRLPLSWPFCPLIFIHGQPWFLFDFVDNVFYTGFNFTNRMVSSVYLVALY